MPLSTVLGAQSLIKPGVCTTATRPASPYTGQTIYDTTVATTLVWSGSAWIGSAGKVLQVINATYSTHTTNSTTTHADTGLTATITPNFSTSKILVFVSLPIRKSSGSSSNELNLNLVRTATIIASLSGQLYTGTALEIRGSASLSYLDSPATTSATTYKMTFANNTAASEVSVQAYGVSTITLMEISA